MAAVFPIAHGTKGVTTAVSKPAGKLHSIEALRGLAALMVLVYHARAELWEGLASVWRRSEISVESVIGLATLPFSFGYLGVPLFFVLSGFCIHLRQARNPAAAFATPAFYRRRFWRIYPTYVAALLVSGAVVWWLVSRGDQLAAARDLSLASFLGSLFTVQGLATPFFAGNTVFWTLAIEIQIYLLYPLLLLLDRSAGAKLTLALTAIVSVTSIVVLRWIDPASIFPYWNQGGQIFSKFLFTWTVGMYVADLYARGRVFPGPVVLLGGLGMGGVGILLTLWGWQDIGEIGFALCFGGVLLWAVSPGSAFIWESRAMWPLVMLGTFSYSLYAIHPPILWLAKELLDPNDIHRSSLIPLFAGCGMAIGAAFILYLLVEQWSINPRRKADR